MRDPHISLEKVPGWAPFGMKLSRCLDKVLEQHQDKWETMMDQINEDAEGFPAAMEEDARRAVDNLLGLKNRRTYKGHIRTDIMEAMTAQAKDPDDVLHEWLSGQTPLGIKNPIQCRGIFPLSSDRQGDGASMDEVHALCRSTE